MVRAIRLALEADIKLLNRPPERWVPGALARFSDYHLTAYPAGIIVGTVLCLPVRLANWRATITLFHYSGETRTIPSAMYT